MYEIDDCRLTSCPSLAYLLGGWGVVGSMADIGEIDEDYRYFSFEIKNTVGKVNFVTITCTMLYDGTDVYCVRFYCRTLHCSTLIGSFETPCKNQLLDKIESETGLNFRVAIEDYDSKNADIHQIIPIPNSKVFLEF